MITITQDPMNPTRLLVTQTISFYLDKVLIGSLTEELAQLIRAQARKDLKSNPEVKKAVAEAASRKLLAMLGVESQQSEGKNGNERKEASLSGEVAKDSSQVEGTESSPSANSHSGC
jgi:hypothetical protein